MPSLNLLQEFPLKGRVWRVALHPEKTLAVISSYFEIGAWELPSGKLLWKEPYGTKAGTQHVSSMALSPDGQRLALSIGLELHVWAPLTGKILKTFPTKERFSNTRMTFNPDGNILWAGARDVMCWSLDKEVCIERFTGPKKGVHGLNAARARIAAAADKALWLWEPSNPKPLRRYPIARFGMTAVALSPDASCAWTTDTDNHASLWSLKKAKKELIAKSDDLGEGPHELVADPNWRWVLISGQAQMTLIDAQTGATLGTAEPAKHQQHRWADDLSVSRDGTLALSAHIDEAGRLWEIKP